MALMLPRQMCACLDLAVSAGGCVPPPLRRYLGLLLRTQLTAAHWIKAVVYSLDSKSPHSGSAPPLSLTCNSRALFKPCSGRVCSSLVQEPCILDLLSSSFHSWRSHPGCIQASHARACPLLASLHAFFEVHTCFFTRQAPAALAACLSISTIAHKIALCTGILPPHVPQATTTRDEFTQPLPPCSCDPQPDKLRVPLGE
eukprot:scaffold37960_cov17-Tisochrysis_lutea.AAC.3